MPSYTSKKISYNNAEQFKESFFEPEPATLGYVFIGNHVPYANESSPDIISDTVAAEKQVWDNMYAAKKITGNDVELVAARVDWTGNTKYRQFDDTIALDTLLSSNTSQNLKPMYVITTDRNVYLCLSNNSSANSTVQPTGQNLSSNGNISTNDGYIWKYLYNVRPSNKFLSNTWIPAPSSQSKLDYSTSDTIPVDGEITTVNIDNAGTGYYHTSINVSSFLTSCSNLTISDTSYSASNIAVNMSITGTGIANGTYVTAFDVVNKKITLSTETIASGGGSSNTISLKTRAYFDGDGDSVVGDVTLSSNTIGKVTITTNGKNYTRCNVTLYGTGTGANARVILPPKFGHGFNPARDIGASNVMIVEKIGEVDSTEGGLISSNTTYRQYGILINPNKYGETSSDTVANANSVISQTSNVSLLGGSSYNLDEFVYQGTSESAASFSGFVNRQGTNNVNLTRVKGSISIGAPLKGNTTNPTGRIVVSNANPELEPYTGDILYVENITKTQRTDGQAENLKFVIRF
jgi:hypothetical protein